MRGTRAKKIMKLARKLLTKEGISWGEGYNEYNQAMNRVDWVPQLDTDGFPVKDPDGEPLIKPEYCPGTLTTAHKLRIVYKNLKRMWLNGKLKLPTTSKRRHTQHYEI